MIEPVLELCQSANQEVWIGWEDKVHSNDITHRYRPWLQVYLIGIRSLLGLRIKKTETPIY